VAERILVAMSANRLVFACLTAASVSIKVDAKVKAIS
jgi:hypothetical protein